MKTTNTKNAKRLLSVAAGIAFMFSVANLYLTNIVTVTAEIPESIQLGTTVPVTITIDKGSIDGFGRFTCTLPKDYQAVSEDQNFSFDDHTITMLWVMLPESDVFSFTFDIIVPEKTKSSFTLSAKFGYVQDNEKRFAELTPQTIKVKEYTGEMIAQAPKPNFNEVYSYRTIEFLDNAAMVSVTTNKSHAQSMCKIEEMLPAGYTIQPLETNGSEVSTIQNVARFMWKNAPETEKFTITYKVIAEKGYNIQDLFVNGALSLYDNGETKSFVITDNYGGTSESTGTAIAATGNHSITIADGASNGFYSSADALQGLADKKYTATEAKFFANTDALNTIYQPTTEEIVAFEEELNIPRPTVEAAAKEYEISQTTETTTTSEIISTKDNPDLIQNLLANGNTAKQTISTIDAEGSQITQTTTQKTTQITTTTTTITPIAQKSSDATATKNTTVQKTVATSQAPKAGATLSNKNNTIQRETKVSAGQKNVSYRVQVAATHRPIKNTKTFFDKRNLTDKVTSERIDNWYKYTVKNFDTYANARIQRNAIWEQTPIKGAFVVAYNGKQRITVQEALMLTNQKWIK